MKVKFAAFYLLFILPMLPGLRAQNVGIGTTTPTATLDVNGEIRAGSTGTAAGTVGAGALRWNGTSLQVSNGTTWQSLSATSNWQLTGNTGTNSAVDYLGTADATDFVLRTSALERVRISAAGNVGIGDASPAAALTVGNGDLFQVVSTGHVRGILGTVGAPTYSFTGSTNTGIYSPAVGQLAVATAGVQRVLMDNTGVAITGNTSVSGRVGIGSGATTASAALEVASTSQGMLPPRMTTAQRDLISGPTNGLVIFNTTTNCVEFYLSGSWKSVCGDPLGCDYNNVPNTGGTFNVDRDTSESFPINFTAIAGTPGAVTTVLLNTITGVTLAGVTNQGANLALGGTLVQNPTIAVASTATVGSYLLQFQHSTTCGVTKYSFVTLNITGCDMSLALSSSTGSTQQANTTVSTLLNIFQAGSQPGTAETTFDETYPGITATATNNNCGITCAQTLNFAVTTTTPGGTYPYTVRVKTTCGATITERTVTYTLTVDALPRNCLQILIADPTANSGVYTIDPDGTAGTNFAAMQCQCDMDPDGNGDKSDGGWTLVANYNHLGGTNPAANVRTNSLPLLGSTSLGVNEQGTAFWGHAACVGANSLMSTLSFSEIRFFGRSSGHGRTLHFYIADPSGVAYAKTGTGGFNITTLRSAFVAMTGHNAFMPASADNRWTNRGNGALIDAPFWQNGTFRVWGAAHAGGQWEMDDNPDNANNSTIHQVWIR